MISKIPPRARRTMARYVNSAGVLCEKFNIPNKMPLQLYKKLARVRLPRRYSNHIPFRVI